MRQFGRRVTHIRPIIMGTAIIKEHLLDQSSESASPQALCVIAGVFLGVFDFLFKDLLCHSDTRRSAGEPEQRSLRRAFNIRSLRRAIQSSELPRSASLRTGCVEGSTHSDGLSEERCRRLWFSHYPRPDQGEGKLA